MQARGLTVVMMTGDNEATAQAIGRQVGITRLFAEVLPAEKASYVKQLQAEGHVVAMVGDGINDAPALAQADVGMAIGTGTDVAMETADITLMSGDLSQLPFAYRLSRATMNTIWVNVALAIGVKLAFVGLVVAGLGSMWLAVAADVGTSLVVTLNGMRLIRKGGE
jgi:P-type E1-E2 ATPase